MIIEQIYTGCLAQGAYYIESKGEVAIIDPLRETSPYISRAERAGAEIKYIFETHFHADFVSGHVDLSRKTGAPIIYGPNATPEYDAISASDGQEFSIGELTIKVLHTPGHTMESSCYLLSDKSGEMHAIFTGDTLFLGDVGRPDLAQKSADMTKEELASLLYDSLHTKILPLPDHITVYPAHGAGSACGKNMMSITQDSLGNQKKLNYALDVNLSKEEFIAQLLDGLSAPPAYFPLNVKLNRTGYQAIDEVMSQGTIALSPKDFLAKARSHEALVLDVRTKDEFAEAHIPGSIFIGLDGSFAPWVGELIVDVRQKLLLVVPEGRAEEAVKRLARVGFDHTLGYLQGGISAWREAGMELDQVERTTADELKSLLETDAVVDCRKPGEYAAGHLAETPNLPLGQIGENWKDYPLDQPIHVHCRSGYRSMVAVSILKSRGLHHVKDVAGGYIALEKAGIPMVVEASTCAS